MLIEVLTRCYKRPHMLAANQASLDAQTDDDWQQTLLVDDVAVSQTFVADIKRIAEAHNPDVIMVKMDHKERGILPGKYWQQQPQLGDIGCSAFVVKRDIWQRHARYFGSHYAGDFDFIASIFARDYEIYWFDCVASAVQRISLGAAE